MVVAALCVLGGFLITVAAGFMLAIIPLWINGRLKQLAAAVVTFALDVVGFLIVRHGLMEAMRLCEKTGGS